MDKRDRIALTQALAMCRTESEGRARQIDSMLKDRDRAWTEVASFAASCCQSKSLALQPWESPPCNVDEDDDSDINADAVKLLRKMLVADVSRYDPDPLKALAGAKRRSSR